MSKIISNIEQLDEGGINPKSGIHEDKLWRLHFDDDSEPRVLGRNKVLEYLTKGTVPPKTVHSFRRWIITTSQDNSIRTWVVVYDDKSHVQLINKDFYSLMTNGHKKKDEEKEDIPKKGWQKKISKRLNMLKRRKKALSKKIAMRPIK